MAIKFVGFAKSFPTEGCTFASVKRSQKRNENRNGMAGQKKFHTPCNICIGKNDLQM